MKPPALTPEEREELLRHLTSISAPRRSYFALVILSTTIAAYGLLSNSTAVVIGAMLVAPLMGPIFGISLALCGDHRRLLRLAAISEFSGVLLAVGIALGIGLAPFRPDFGSEILGRTQPTVYDILIALASGFAGAYAFVSPKLNPALAGVAIATALVPPLATCGLCLSAGEWRLGSGAFVLFLANFLAIEIAGAIVFTHVGLGISDGALRLLTRRFSGSLLALLAVGLFLTHTLVKVVQERRVVSRIEATLGREVGITTGARLASVRTTREEGTLRVVVEVLTPQAFDPAQIAQLEDKLSRILRTRLHLIVRSLISRDADRDGPVFLPVSDTRQRAMAEAEAKLLQKTSSLVEEAVGSVNGARLVDLRREASEDGPTRLTAVVRTPTAINPQAVSEMQERLVGQLGQPVQLLVRSVLTRDADADQFLYNETEPPSLTTAEVRVRERLTGALGRLLAAGIPGASLSELQITREGRRVDLLATVRTPRNFDPEHVRPIETTLRRHVDPAIRLVIRSIVGTDASADGYRRSHPGSSGSP